MTRPQRRNIRRGQALIKANEKSLTLRTAQRSEGLPVSPFPDEHARNIIIYTPPRYVDAAAKVLKEMKRKQDQKS